MFMIINRLVMNLKYQKKIKSSFYILRKYITEKYSSRSLNNEFVKVSMMNTDFIIQCLFRCVNSTVIW